MGSSLLRRRQVPSELPHHLPVHERQYNDKNYDPYLRRKPDDTKRSKAIFICLTLTGLLVVLAVLCLNGGTSSEDVRFGRDSRKDCRKLAQAGECITNRRVVLAQCPQSCFVHAGVAIDSLSSSDVLEDAKDGFAFYHHVGPEKTDCQDHKDECQELADAGECVRNSEYMLESCPKSCLACFGDTPTTVTIDFGVEQKLVFQPEDGIAQRTDTSLQTDVLQVIKSSSEYMVSIFQNDKYRHLRRDCRNLDQYCSIYAAMGECHGENDALAMFQNCAPACHACESVALYQRCLRRPEDIDIIPEGKLDSLFQRIVRDFPQYKTTVLSQPSGDVAKDQVASPWILYLDNFLSNDECDKIMAHMQNLHFEAAEEIGDEIEEDGNHPAVVGSGWNADTAWCQGDCENEPTLKAVMDRINELMKFPIDHTETLEFVKYSVGGHYEDHHDVIETQGNLRCGNRILSVYIFFNDVESGGELFFTEIEKTVTPAKGRIVIWNNVLNDDFTERDDGTFKEFKPVKKGTSIGAHWWFHPRNIRSAWEDDCCTD